MKKEYLEFQYEKKTWHWPITRFNDHEFEVDGNCTCDEGEHVLSPSDLFAIDESALYFQPDEPVAYKIIAL